MAREEESARYWEAAQLALGQLDWCVDYFRSIRKPRISKQIARNRDAIRRMLRDNTGGEGARGRW
jgi:hypothetical protein